MGSTCKVAQRAAFGVIVPGQPHVTIQTTVTPNLEGAPGGSFIPKVRGAPFLFHDIGEDWESNRIDMHMPLVFVIDDDARQPPALLDTFNHTVVDYRDSLSNVDMHS